MALDRRQWCLRHISLRYHPTQHETGVSGGVPDRARSGQNQSGAAALFSQNPALAAIAGLSGAGANDSIATEVQILNSPSVLRPIFDAVKARKKPKLLVECVFKTGPAAITAEEEKGTSVLTVEFRDTDKNLVLPITRMISEAYQSYSNRGRARELANVITYLKDQIGLIKPQAKASSRAALTTATPMASACSMVSPSGQRCRCRSQRRIRSQGVRCWRQR